MTTVEPRLDVPSVPASGPAAGLVDYTHLHDAESRTAHRLYEQLIGLWGPGVIEAANDLDVFGELRRGPAGATGLAAALGTDERATRVLLDALYAFGLVERTGTAREGYVYHLDPTAAACLVGEGASSLQGKLVYDRRLAWGAWRGLSETVRTGTRPDDGEEQQNQIHEDDYVYLANGIRFWAEPVVGLLATALAERGWGDGSGRRLLDVGCGTGHYSHLLLDRFPRAEATGLDVPGILKMAHEEAENRGVADRFHGDGADFLADPWPGSQDLVLFANIFHLQPAQLAERLLESAAGALADGGVVCIVDQIRLDEEERERPQDRFALLFAASMLATGGGDTYRLSQYDRWLAATGLRRVALVDAPMHRILLAAKA